jgi:hypothetical protein
MSTKTIVRLVAKFSENESTSGNFRLVLVCGIDAEKKIVEGEWSGFTHNNDLHYPFVLQRSPFERLYLGNDNKYYEPSNLPSTKIEVGERFHVSNHPDDPQGSWTVEYTITSVHSLG